MGLVYSKENLREGGRSANTKAIHLATRGEDQELPMGSGMGRCCAGTRLQERVPVLLNSQDGLFPQHRTRLHLFGTGLLRVKDGTGIDTANHRRGWHAA